MHVHRPKPLHGWREMSVEVAVIVLGIVIAIGLEQAVEFVHRHEQREALSAAIQRDSERNRAYIKTDIAEAQAIYKWAMAQASTLERGGPSGPLRLYRLRTENIGAPDAGVWPSAKAGGLTNLLPPSAQNWLEYLNDEYNDTFVSTASATGQLTLAYAALDQVVMDHATGIGSQEIDLTSLNANQRVLAIECLHAIAEHARTVLRHLVIYDAGNEYILSTPLDQLDTPEAGKHYSQIYRQELQSHPGAKFSFSRP